MTKKSENFIKYGLSLITISVALICVMLGAVFSLISDVSAIKTNTNSMAVEMSEMKKHDEEQDKRLDALERQKETKE